MRKVKILLNGVSNFYSRLRFTAKRERRRRRHGGGSAATVTGQARARISHKKRAVSRESPTALHGAAGRLLIVLPTYCVVRVAVPGQVSKRGLHSLLRLNTIARFSLLMPQKNIYEKSDISSRSTLLSKNFSRKEKKNEISVIGFACSKHLILLLSSG